MKNIKRYLLIFIGTISLVLGVAGVFLPLLPTTPFLLLSSFCYLKSSHKLHNWLLSRKVIGAYVHNYITNKAVSKSTKIFSLIMLWLTLILSIVFINHWHVRAFLLIVGIGVTIHLMSLKTITKSGISRQNAYEDLKLKSVKHRNSALK